MKKFTFYKQLDQMDCGPACLRMIAKYYGRQYSAENLREKSYLTREGISMLSISDAAENIGFKTLMARITFDKLKEEKPVPFIAHWRRRHFIVVLKFGKKSVLIADPGHGIIKLSDHEFTQGWLSTPEDRTQGGVVLLMEPTNNLYKTDDEEQASRSSFSFIFTYLRPYRRFVTQLSLGMLVGSLLQLLLPLLTQTIVDVGINYHDIGFINLILIGQLVLFISRTSLDFIRSWIILHIGSRINMAILSDFLIKLMKLPIAFFDTRKIGDLLQRINDHKRIENFLTSSVLNAVFSATNLIIFGIVLAFYNSQVFWVFFAGSALYALWILLFLRKRRELDYKFFDQMSINQNSLIHLINGMQEIKLHNSERRKRWEWERIQIKVFKLGIKTLTLNQYQQAGSVFINESKNIVITYLCAKAVIDGSISLGMMLAAMYIIGQLNAPVHDLINFTRSIQDAKISMERLGEVHNRPDEDSHLTEGILFPEERSLTFRNVNFQYEGPRSPKVLKDINLEIPEGKITAIVGDSGSGKTTLLKLLLRFYEPVSGEIVINHTPLNKFSNFQWREKCGAVMQDGYIFADTIANNIAIGEDVIDFERLFYAVNIANIREHIESLPLKYETVIGADGMGLSMGQRQRILIARVVYKNPEYIFFDEATNSLDANNEKIIVANLAKFFVGRTVVVVAHRLSTVVNADKIVVLHRGEIAETGSHEKLTQNRGAYYSLIKNQLELGT